MKIYHVNLVLIIFIILYFVVDPNWLGIKDYGKRDPMEFKNQIKCIQEQIDSLHNLNKGKILKNTKKNAQISHDLEKIQSRYAQYEFELTRYEDSLIVMQKRYMNFGNSVQDYINTQLDWNMSVDEERTKQLFQK